ncbi:MAG: hypothetical protein COB78_05845 [Hyphomicrobiales bacterium]|nr:MAG: hypothetical protein COB78_05845 [Hyphomicrobiales bacterium]
MAISDEVLALLAAGERSVTIDELDQALPDHSRKEIIKTIGRLRYDKLTGSKNIGCYFATDNGRQYVASGKTIKSGPKKAHTGQRRRVSGTMTTRLWKALRAQRKATTIELVSLARTKKDGKPEATAARILRMWFNAGFITKLGRRRQGSSPTSNGYVVWFLVRDNGPKAPAFDGHRRCISDLNNGEIWTLCGEPWVAVT